MNLYNHEQKNKLYGDKIPQNQISVPKWSQNISDLVKKSHQQKFQLNAPPQNQDIQFQNNRLVQKLVNIHHQTSGEQPPMGIKLSQTAQGFMLRDQNKRVTLDECTNNFAPQKNLNQNYLQAQQPLNNITSNRSGSSQGFVTLKSNNGINTAKAVGQFKFNLTLNRNKQQQPNQKSQDLTGFYPTQQHQQIQQLNDDQHVYDNMPEDNEANFLNQLPERQKTIQPRGRSNLGPRQQSKFMLVQTIQDQNNQDDMLDDYNDLDEEFDNQRMVKKRQSNSQATRQAQNTVAKKVLEKFNLLNDTNLDSMEERQKIFEEEIIKRVKEIQKYAKTLHLTIKKIQSSNGKRQEEWQQIKEQLTKLKEDVEKDDVNEQIINEMIESKLQQNQVELQLQLSNLEIKLGKESDNKLQRVLKNNQNELNLQIDNLKSDIISQVYEDYIQQLKAELSKALNDKFSSSIKIQEKSQQEVKEQINSLSQEIEDIKLQNQQFQKDSNFKHEKSQKYLIDTKDSINEQIMTLQESTNEQFDQMKKKIAKELKNEFDFKQFATQSDLNDSLAQFNSRISLLNDLVNKKSDQSEDVNIIQQNLQSIQSQQENNDRQMKTFLNKLQNLERQLQETSDIDQIKNQLDLNQEKISNIQITQDTLQQEQQEQQENFSNILEQLNQVKELQYQGERTVNTNIQQLQGKIQNEIDDLRNEVDHKILEQSNKVQQQVPAQINEDQIVESVLLQIDPQFEDLKYKISQLEDDFQGISDSIKQESKQQVEQLDYVKQQISQKLNRQEVQEIKSDLDDQINQISKQLKKVDERLHSQEEIILDKEKQINEIANQQAQMKEQVVELQFQVQNEENFEEINQNIDQLNERIEKYVNDLNERIDDVKSHQPQHFANKNDEDLEEHIKQLKENFTMISKDLSLKVDIDTFNNQFDSLNGKVVLNDSRINELKSRLAQNNGVEQLDTELKELQQHLNNLTQQNQESVDELHQNIEELSSEIQQQNQNTKSEINELKERMKQPVQQAAPIVQQTKSSEVDEKLQDLQGDLQNITQTFEEKIEFLQTQIKDLESQQEELRSIAQEQPQKLDQLKMLVDQGIRSSNSVQEQLSQQTIQVSQNLLNQIHVLEEKIQSRQSEFQTHQTQQLNHLSDQQNQLSSQISNQDEGLQHARDSIQNIEEAFEKLQDHLEQSIAQLNLNQNQPSSLLDPRIDEIIQSLDEVRDEIEKLKQIRHIPLIEVNKVKKEEQHMYSPAVALEMSNINSCRSPQNFLGSSHKPQVNNPNTNYQGHFLEDLSEADLSNNSQHKYANQTDDGDIMMFNNKTQSLGTSSIMSNKLHNMLSPVESKQQLHFNQQVTEKLTSAKPQVEEIQMVEEQQYMEDEEEYQQPSEINETQQQHQSSSQQQHISQLYMEEADSQARVMRITTQSIDHHQRLDVQNEHSEESQHLISNLNDPQQTEEDLIDLNSSQNIQQQMVQIQYDQQMGQDEEEYQEDPEQLYEQHDILSRMPLQFQQQEESQYNNIIAMEEHNFNEDFNNFPEQFEQEEPVDQFDQNQLFNPNQMLKFQQFEDDYEEEEQEDQEDERDVKPQNQSQIQRSRYAQNDSEDEEEGNVQALQQESVFEQNSYQDEQQEDEEELEQDDEDVQNQLFDSQKLQQSFEHYQEQNHKLEEQQEENHHLEKQYDSKIDYNQNEGHQQLLQLNEVYQGIEDQYNNEEDFEMAQQLDDEDIDGSYHDNENQNVEQRLSIIDHNQNQYEEEGNNSIAQSANNNLFEPQHTDNTQEIYSPQKSPSQLIANEYYEEDAYQDDFQQEDEEEDNQQENSSYQKLEEYGQEGQEEDEEVVELTPQQCSEMLAEFIFSSELEFCLEELDQLKSRQFD